MKTPIAFVLLLSVPTFTACALDDLEDETPGEENPSNDERVVETEVLATIDLGHGTLVYEIVTSGPVAGELSMSETSLPDKSGAVRLPAQTPSLLERYLEATPEGTPIPAAIVHGETNEELLEQTVGRATVERLEGVVDGVASSGPVLSGATAAQMCAEGTTSASFAAQWCTTNSHARLKFCHNGTWTGVTDDTHGFRAWSARSLTLACYATGRVKHRKKFGAWYTTKDRSIPAGAVHQHTTTNQIFPRRRTIRHWRTASGFVRGASFFW